MDRYILVQRKPGVTSSNFTITEEGLSLGRSHDCDIVLADAMVSRQHARVWAEGDNIFIEDLGSRNGVVINRRRVWRGCLYEGDELVIGDQSLSLRRLGEAEEFTEHGTAIKHETAETVVERLVRSAGAERLMALYKATQLLGSVFDLDELLEKTLDLLFDSLTIKRGFILTKDDDEEEPTVRAFRADNGDASDGPPLSETILGHVFDNGDAILTLDAQEDPRFEEAGSVRGHGIHAAMCAPLRGQDELVGAVYVDSGSDEGFFTNDDLEMITAIGRIVGVAVENAHLHHEMVTNERLAAIGQATAGIGHCVKNMLVGVKSGSDFLDMAVAEKNWNLAEKGRGMLATSAERIENLVLNLLAFSRDHKLEFIENHLDGMLDDLVRLMQPRAEQVSVSLTFHRGEVGPFHLDGQQMYRVFLNLVTNAIEACEQSGGEVTLFSRRNPDGCFVDIVDTGVGIPDDIRPKLYHAFVSSKGSKGTGLGLACSDKIVRAHGGAITVQSVPGQGSTFTVFLPVQPNQPTHAKRVEEDDE